MLTQVALAPVAGLVAATARFEWAFALNTASFALSALALGGLEAEEEPLPVTSGTIWRQGIESLSLSVAVAPAAGPSLGGSVVASEVYATQRKVSGRVIVTDGQLVALVDALSSTPSTRLPMTAVASALAISEVRLRGALAQLAQLLNVEGYAVIETDPHTRAVILNERLLRDQFGVR